MPHLQVTLGTLATALGSAALKATVILTLATLLTRLLQRRTAALRHLVWTTALGSIVAVLVLPVVLPAWRVDVPALMPLRLTSPIPKLEWALETNEPAPAGQTVDVQHVGMQPAGMPSQLRDTEHARTGIPTAHRMAAPSRGVSWPAVILGLWLLGVAAVFFRYASSRVALLRLVRWGTPSAESGALVGQISRQMRITRPVCVHTSDDVDMPFTWGIVRPQIVLPGDASEWSPACRRHVLQHELAHIRRLDAGTQLVAQAASTLFWFHPLVWYAVARMRCERERACDDYVLATGAVACDYASDLLALVTNYGYVERHAVALAFARRSQFEGRLLALLDPTVDRGVLSPRRIALVLSVAAAFVVPFAALESAEPPTVPHTSQPTTQPTTQPKTQPSTQRTTQPTTQSATTLTPPVVPPPSMIAVHAPTTSPLVSVATVVTPQSELNDVFSGCTMRMWNHASEHTSSGDGNTVWTASARNDECGFDLKSEGDVVFNRDATAIEHIAAGGYVDVTTNIRGDLTRLVVRASATGALGYELTRNGQRIEFSSVGPAWLEQVLIGLDRTTAFAINQRFPLLLQAGTENVLAEVERMHSDHAKVVYLRRLIERVTLDARALRRTGDVVAAMERSYPAGELVAAIASKYTLGDSAIRAPFLRTALALESDNEQARTFLAITAGATLGGDEIAAVLRSVARMSVDHDKSRVLLGLAATQRLDGDLRTAYVAAGETIRDVRLRERALAGLFMR